MTERNNEVPLLLCIMQIGILLNCELKKNSYFRRSIFHEVYIFSSHINLFKILLKVSHNIESVLAFLIFLLLKSTIFSPLDHLAARFQDFFRTRKSRDGANTTLTTDFFTYPREKKNLCSELTAETTIFIRIMAKFSHNANNYIFDS